CLFASADSTQTPRPVPLGRYTSTCWIPGNLLSEGKIYAAAVISSIDPPVMHVYEHNAVAFEVRHSVIIDPHRAMFNGDYPGVLRPQLRWTTDGAAAAELDLALPA